MNKVIISLTLSLLVFANSSLGCWKAPPNSVLAEKHPKGFQTKAYCKINKLSVFSEYDEHHPVWTAEFSIMKCLHEKVILSDDGNTVFLIKLNNAINGNLDQVVLEVASREGLHVSEKLSYFVDQVSRQGPAYYIAPCENPKKAKRAEKVKAKLRVSTDPTYYWIDSSYKPETGPNSIKIRTVYGKEVTYILNPQYP